MKIDINEKILSQPPRNGKFYLIAIDGRGGAGKTTLTEYIAKLLPEFTILNGDEYFEPAKNTIAFGAFNEERFEREVLEKLRNNEATFTYHPYDWHKKPHLQDKELNITRGIIIERSSSFAFKLDYDLKIWVETPAKLALQRGQERDEMPLEQGYRSWKEVWQPQEDAHFEKYRPLETADIVIDGTMPFDEQLN
ncbi:hypothetical protein KC867_00870 [Candidatus Saccharibacteria bacterium]|nr:hypothetical protein [Candidatus Saccharibacteria bacterium]